MNVGHAEEAEAVMAGIATLIAASDGASLGSLTANEARALVSLVEKAQDLHDLLARRKAEACVNGRPWQS